VCVCVGGGEYEMTICLAEMQLRMFRPPPTLPAGVPFHVLFQKEPCHAHLSGSYL